MADTEGEKWSTAITADNRGPLVTITVGLMLVAMFLFLGFRLTIRWPWPKLIGYDDLATMLGSLFAFGQSLAVFIAIDRGLGQHLDTLDAKKARDATNAIYASDVLSVVALTGSKLAVSLLLMRLSTYKRHINAARVITAVICVWGLIATVITALEIKRARADVRSAWIGLGALSIVLEVALFVLPIFLVWNLKMRLSAKITVVVGFAFRIPASALALARVLAVAKMLSAEEEIGFIDYTWDYINPTIFTTIEMHYSLMAATIPCMHLFLRQFSTGYLGTTNDQLHGTMIGSQNDQTDSYALSSIRSKNRKTAKSRRGGAVRQFSHSEAVSRALYQVDAAVTTISASRDRAGSVVSDGSEKIMVRHTVDVKWSESEECSPT
ncbi:hypothetical protein DOTSEDRAFT_55874 [Dothistroma septosporum NZE10]|uniref:Rhodopsin domain-containing protein n=1 Tax=Dothistroma septosporum (strain NZE10 / CBS 128990) TaxID=675120 RepID=N1PGV0_DOTSN|nr:hypothetical protein DOTSEDRAFT_55874 [Dothistroma septosporum NZE10]